MKSVWNVRHPGAWSLHILTVLVASVALLWASVQGADAAPIPFGSYQQSCQNIRASSGILRANCQTRRGDYIRARLENYAACRGDIANADGRLVCREIPGDIILFENSSFRGRWLPITADTNLPRWLDDRTSSIRVRRGVWQVCSDRDFRGRCEIIRGDIRDLRSLRLNDRISSVRRILPRPEGSYLQSCSSVRFDGRFLSADCRDRRGRVRPSQLDVRSCPPGSDIFVRRGELSCGDRLGYDDRDDYSDNNGYDDSRVPQGSYLRTCRYPRMDGSTLRAECQDRNGNWSRSSLEISNCRRDISNDDGELICGDADDRWPPPPPLPPQGQVLPPGSYQQSCRYMEFERGTLSGECRTRSGGW
jgi:hypothetical protein